MGLFCLGGGGGVYLGFFLGGLFFRGGVFGGFVCFFGGGGLLFFRGWGVFYKLYFNLLILATTSFFVRSQLHVDTNIY